MLVNVYINMNTPLIHIYSYTHIKYEDQHRTALNEQGLREKRYLEETEATKIRYEQIIKMNYENFNMKQRARLNDAILRIYLLDGMNLMMIITISFKRPNIIHTALDLILGNSCLSHLTSLASTGCKERAIQKGRRDGNLL